MEENAPSATPPLQPPPAPVTPPPPMPPPIITPYASPPPPRRGRGWMVFALILLVLLAISMVFNVGGLLSGMLHGTTGRFASRTAGPRLDEVTREDNDASDKIAVVKVDGIITSTAIDQSGYNMVDVIREELKRAREDDKVKAVILKVDSPGGEVLASDQINRAISEFQSDKHQKPVVVSMGNLAASGGYYVSVPGRWIVADELTITGSIGVILSTWNYRGLMDKVGLMPMTFKSGQFKDMLSGSREPESITPEEKAMIQSLIDQTYGRFKEVVEKGRSEAHEKNKKDGRPLVPDWADYADGRVFSGKEAYQRGFVDQVGTFEDAVKKAKALGGVTGAANLVEYEQRHDLSDVFRLFGRSESKAVKLELGVETPKLNAGQLYFLAPTFFR